MGTSSKHLNAQLKERLGLSASGRPPLAPALQAYFCLLIEGDPPTTTHHDKEIKYITGKSGKRHATLLDSPSLKAARAFYELAIRERRELIPLVPPIMLRVEFQFTAPEAQWGFSIAKPDLDNSVKLVKDVLTLRGYWHDDKHVAMEQLTKTFGARGWVRIYARSLHGLGDAGAVVRTGREEPGRLYPVPWLTKADLAAFEAAAQSPAARAIGTPGGIRKPDWPKKGSGK